MTRLAVFENQLRRLDDAGRLRSLSLRSGRDFSSNDYMGLSGDAWIAGAVARAINSGVPVGSAGSRLLRGNTEQHEELEKKAAAFFKTEAALFFSSGFAANAALFSTLPQTGDLIVADELIHASAHEGLRRSRGSHFFVPHNDAGAVADRIRDWRRSGGSGHVWIAVETLYSMDGDMAPVDDLAALADAEDAWLLVDEAHATGVYGPGGRGLAAHLEGRDNVITLHTCGKAMGAEGALVTGPRPVIDFLINRARSFIFSTAPSPLIASAVSASLDRIEAGDELRARLQKLIAHAGQRLCAGLGLPPPRSQIIPVYIGEERRAVAAAERLRLSGFDVRAIRPPTVPEGSSRLRISLTLNVGEEDVDALSDALREVLM